MMRRLSAPENEAPVTVPANMVLARGPHAAVLLTFVLAYSTGTELGVSIRVWPRTGRRTKPLHQLIAGMGPDEPDVNREFLLGVQYADGRRTMTSGWRRMPTPAVEDGEQALSLVQGMSGGSDNTYDLRFWLSPLPPPGPVTVVCRFPEFGIDETQVVLDGTAIAAAGRDAVELWPVQIPDEPVPEPPALLLPDGGWFAGQDQRATGD